MAKEVLELLWKIENPRTPGKKAVRRTADECMRRFLAHLDWLKSRHCKKPYSMDYLVSVAFQRQGRMDADAEVMAYCRVHLSIAIAELRKLAELMKGNKRALTAHALRRYRNLLRDYLHDLRPIAEYLEQRRDKNYLFFDGGKFYGVMAWQLFRASRQLSITSVDKRIALDHKISHIAAIFMLRSALEAKFERLIGVHLYDKNDQSPKLRHGFHYAYIKKNMHFYKFTSLSFPLLEYIYSWCKEIVHRSVQPFVWQLSYALEVCSGLFTAGPLTEKGGWSVNGGVRILDTDTMQRSYVQHFIQHYDHGIWCVEPATPEAVCDYLPLKVSP